MSKTMHRRTPKYGFTLIELLVLITIIAIIASILIPALAATKSNAMQTKCLGNIRQIGMSIIAYASDHDGWAPVTNSDWAQWIIKLSSEGYIEDYGIYQCPEDSNRRSINLRLPNGSWERRITSYGINENLTNPGRNQDYAAFTSIVTPSIMPVVADSCVPVIWGDNDSRRARITNANSADQWFPPTTPAPSLKRHKDGNAVFFADGSTRIVEQEVSQSGYLDKRFNYAADGSY